VQPTATATVVKTNKPRIHELKPVRGTVQETLPAVSGQVSEPAPTPVPTTTAPAPAPKPRGGRHPNRPRPLPAPSAAPTP
jgi:hypothetical protein